MGIGGGIAAAIFACKATLKVEEVLDEHQGKVDTINTAWEKVKEGEIALDVYSEQDYKKDLAITYVQTGVGFLKLYGPALSLAATSIFCIVSSHGIMRKRVNGLTAAYVSLAEAFNQYRRRVREELGEENEYMIRHGLKSETVTELTENPDGSAKKVKKKKLIGDPNGISGYARYFDKNSTEWTPSAEYNLTYIKHQQASINDFLKAKGHVFLNEVYDMLGIPRTQAGAVVGWVMGDDGDNYIDFGIFDGDKVKREFVNGYDDSILLDFNVDGVIYHLIEERS